jgi:hypothetical protein
MLMGTLAADSKSALSRQVGKFETSALLKESSKSCLKSSPEGS